MISRIGHGQIPTIEKLNEVIDALNAVTPAPSSLPMHSSSKGSDVSVPRRPRSFYAIIKESPDRQRDINGEVNDGEYEWARVHLSGGAGFAEAEGEEFGSFYDVTTGLLHNPAYELNDDRKVAAGMIVRMRPVEPVIENDVVATDGQGNLILDPEGNPIVEEVKRGFLRRYAFAEPVGKAVEVVQTHPDEGKRYSTANRMGVFDGHVVSLDPNQFGEEGGDLREAFYNPTGVCWMLPLRETPEQMVQITYGGGGVVGTFLFGERVEQEGTGAEGWFFEDDGVDTIWIHADPETPEFDGGGLITGIGSGATCQPTAADTPQEALDEEKLGVLPSFTRFKGLLMGELDFDGDRRPLYVFDNELAVRQFELLEDWLQNADETWDSHRPAVFVDQPGGPEFELHKPSELHVEGSAYHVGVGRVGVEGHKGSCGFCRWSRTAKRWEFIDGCFKIVGIGVTSAGFIAHGARGTVRLYWKKLTVGLAWDGIEDSTMDVNALNVTDENIRAGSYVSMAFDRQENLWFILGVQFPVHVETTLLGVDSEIGHLLLDDTAPGLVGIYFNVTNPGADPHIVRVEGRSKGANVAALDMNAPGRTLDVSNGLISGWA